MVRVEARDDSATGVVVLTLDRPERRNAVDLPTLHALRDAQLGTAADARVVVLTGAPPAFCAGADLNGVDDQEFAAALSAVLTGFTELPGVVLAAVDGPALGAGTQLAVACDLRIASPRARFGIPAARLGLAVDRWTVDRLVDDLGASTARAMLLAAETFGAEDLHRAGAVHRLGHLDDALAWAGELARLAPLSIRAHKVALRGAPTGGGRDERADAAFETARAAAWASADAVEGRTAFLEKRPAAFTGS